MKKKPKSQVKQTINKLGKNPKSIELSFDANGDDKFSKSELVKVMEALDSSPSEDKMVRVMEEIDTDRDGFINLEEFASFCKAGSGDGDSGDGELLEAFEMHDQDKDGKVSGEELLHILTHLGEKCTVQDTAKMIESLDSDDDGFVNFDEFKKME